ncbi:MAG: ATP-binding protein [Clostridiales bacterium]|nr:ATP-binding protein [Clostridiales bacterium]
MQSLRIHNLGPIKDFQLDITEFMVFTGKQASGKSTVAKAIFFFKNIPALLNTEIRKGRMEKNQEKDSLKSRLIKSVRVNFVRTFGSTLDMDFDMCLEYYYVKDVSIRVSLTDGPFSPNYLRINLSEQLERFLTDVGRKTSEEILQHELRAFFDQEADVIYIPAGRSMLTLLSNQLGYIYGTMDDIQKKDLDYCTQNYLELILKLKSFFWLH